MEHNWGVSVVVCCYNSSEKLSGTLDALFKLKSGRFPLEIIVVDNNSDDDTAQIAVQVGDSYGANHLRIVRETQPGLSYARRAGILAAKYEIIIFCDDDNYLCEEYAVIARSIFLRDPRIGVIGGNGREVLDTKPPVWWPLFSKSFAVGPQGDISGPVKRSRSYVYGAGMCVRRSIMMKLIAYNFEPLLKDRKGQELTSGGDVEICLLLRAMGYEIWYDHGLKFDHIIDNRRLGWDYYLRLKRGIGRSFPVTFAFGICINKPGAGVRSFIGRYVRTVRSMVRSYFDRDRNQYKAEINRLVASSALSYLIFRPFLMIRTFNKVKQIILGLREDEHR